MPDPVTNVQIEDVLSSIRRLVSERVKATDEPSDPKPGSDRLVLTPSLRVAVAEPEPAVTQASSLQQGESADAEDVSVAGTDRELTFDRARLERADVPFDRASLEATIAELEAAVTEQSDDWEPDGSDLETPSHWAKSGFPSDQPVTDAIEIVDEAELSEPWAALGTLRAAQEVRDHDILSSVRAAALPFTDDGKIGELAQQEDLTLAEDRVADDAAPRTRPALHQEPPVTFRHEAETEPQDDYQDGLRSEATHADEDDLATYLAHDSVIDEAALRQIVLDVLREELQGKLGEKITRNVRKLVRREINRVLSDQDLT